MSLATIMAALSEYNLLFYENSSPKRDSENILSEKQAVQLLNLSSFQIDKGQFIRFSSDFERRTSGSSRSSFPG